MCWERVDPPWELPNYIGDLLQALENTKAWITSGGVVEQVAVATLLNLPQPMAPSDGESEVRASNTKLPSPHQVITKVQQVDDMEHTLNKGLWVGTRAIQWGWKIFVNLSFTFPF